MILHGFVDEEVRGNANQRRDTRMHWLNTAAGDAWRLVTRLEAGRMRLVPVRPGNRSQHSTEPMAARLVIPVGYATQGGPRMAE